MFRKLKSPLIKIPLIIVFMLSFFLGDIAPVLAGIGDPSQTGRTIQKYYDEGADSPDRAPDFIMFNPNYSYKNEVNLYEYYKNMDPKKSSYYDLGGMPDNKKWHLTTFVRPKPDGSGNFTFQVYTPEEYGIGDDWFKYGGVRGQSGNHVRYLGTWPGGNTVFSDGDNVS